MNIKLKNKNQKGFTLIELIIVVAVIGVLTAIAIPVYGSIQETSKKNAVKAAAEVGYTSYLSQINELKTDADAQALALKLNKPGADILIYGTVGLADNKKICVTAYWIADEDNNRKYPTQVGECGA